MVRFKTDLRQNILRNAQMLKLNNNKQQKLSSVNGIKLKNYVKIVIHNIKKSHNKYVFLVNNFILLSNIFPTKKEDSTKVKSSQHKNAPCWSATSCSPTDLLRSTIGARGLNFWVRNGTRCASPAMVADQQGAFLYHKGFLTCPEGRTV